MIPATTAGFSIRDARPDDLDAIAGFNAALATETEGKTLDDEVLRAGVASALGDPDRLRYWVAQDDASRAIIGQAAVTREWSDWRNGWVWWFQSVYVGADHRRRGVFRALYQHIRTMASASRDVVGLRLYVEQQNNRAQRVYESMGMNRGGYEVFEDLWINPSPD